MCVNEKAQQIPKMRDIYVGADRTIAWLGESPLSKLSAGLVSDMNFRLKSWSGTEIQFYLSCDREGPAWHAFLQLFRHEYFLRAWIFQEVALGHNLQFYLGGRYLRAHELTSAMLPFTTPEVRGTFCRDNHFMAEAGDDFHGFFNLVKAQGLRPRDQPGDRFDAAASADSDDDNDDDNDNKDFFVPLGLLLSATSSLHATKAVDKVYALLGVSGSQTARSIIPNYTIPVADVYVDAAARLLACRYEAGFVFPHAGIGTTNHAQNHVSINGLPSWVPNWQTETWRRSFILTLHTVPGEAKLPRRLEGTGLSVEALSAYAAGGADGARPRFIIDRATRRLTTWGLRVDTIQMPFPMELDTTSRSQRSYVQWINLLEKFVIATDEARREEMQRLRLRWNHRGIGGGRDDEDEEGDALFGVWKPVRFIRNDMAALPRTLTADRDTTARRRAS